MDKGSKKRFIVVTGLFVLVSLIILLYPRGITVKGAGETVSAANYSVPAAVSGKVIEVCVAEGSEVQAGTLIMRLSNDKLTREIEELEKALEINKAVIGNLVEKDKVQHKELRKGINRLPRGILTSPAVEAEQKKLEIILKDTAIACKEKDRIASKLKYLQAFKKKEDIKAPIDGVILTPIKKLTGRYLPEGEEAFRVGGKSLVVECFIPQSQAKHVSVGSPVILKSNDRSGKDNHGIIIGMDANSDNAGAKNITVRVTIGITDAIVLTRGVKYQVWIYTQQRTSLVKDILRHLPL